MDDTKLTKEEEQEDADAGKENRGGGGKE